MRYVMSICGWRKINSHKETLVLQKTISQLKFVKLSSVLRNYKQQICANFESSKLGMKITYFIFIQFSNSHIYVILVPFNEGFILGCWNLAKKESTAKGGNDKFIYFLPNLLILIILVQFDKGYILECWNRSLMIFLPWNKPSLVLLV